MFKKLFLVIGLVLALAFPAFAEPWVGTYFGSQFTMDNNVNFSNSHFSGSYGGVTTDSGFKVGGQVGYNFDKYLGNYELPYWAKYFGVVMDFGYNPYKQPGQTVGVISNHGNGTIFLPQGDGYQLGLGFMVKAHYPCLVSKDFPKGQLQPYIMAGPGLVWTTARTNTFNKSATSTDFAVMTEAGVEYFITPAFAVNTGLTYRHVFGPSFSNTCFKTKTELDQLGVVAGFRYHF